MRPVVVKSAIHTSLSGLLVAALSYPVISSCQFLDPQYAMIIMLWYFITQYKHSKENIVTVTPCSDA